MAVFGAALRAVEPGAAVRRALKVAGSELQVNDARYDLASIGRILVVGAGKAAALMSQAVEQILGDRLTRGLCTVKYGHGAPTERICIREAGHPLPDEAGVRAAREILELVESAEPRDLVICLLSGGGSALLPLPAEGLRLEDKTKVTEILLACGADVREINAVRKHISRIKGGQLAQAAAHARVVSLIMSDVIDDPIDAVASGPTAPDPTTFGECISILNRYGTIARMPPSVLERLRRGAVGQIPETPKPGDPIFGRVQNVIVANNRLALEAAADEAKRLGYEPRILPFPIRGEAREAGRLLASLAGEIRQEAPSGPTCLLAGGETTVTVRGGGKGGRNQELALSAARQLDGVPNVLVLSAGTDGTDGPTDAAGAFADGATLKRAKERGLEADDYLSRNDSYHFFKPLGDLLVTGPTRTNVMDIQILLVA